MSRKDKKIKLCQERIGLRGKTVQKKLQTLTTQPRTEVDPLLPPNEDLQPIPIHVHEDQLPSTSTASNSTHYDKTRKNVESWATFSANAIPHTISGYAYGAQAFCNLCKIAYDDEERPPCRCKDCYHFDHCLACSGKIHDKKIPFHHPEIWDKETESYKAIEYDRLITNTKREKCSKGGMLPITETIDVVTDAGHIFQCSFQIHHCECHPFPVQLAELGFWPASHTQPSTCFSFGFLNMARYMMLEGHMSLQAICQTFMWTCSWTATQCRKIYRQLVGQCFEEFKHFMFKLENDESSSIGECPACLKNGSVFYSLDGNFGLVRKKNSGTSHQPPKHNTRLFLNDDDVDSFVKTHSEGDATSAEDCSTFQAGDLLRTKNKARGLDQTGVFGCICRHGTPKLFLNMKYGERFAYPILLILEVLSRTPDEANPVIIYDIACKLHSHLQRVEDIDINDIVQKAEFAVPCWHAYGHGKSCQTKYSTQWKKGCCMTDGEEMERLWSYLRRFSHITKEMTPSHRIDLLTDALLHYAKRKSLDIALSLVKRAAKAEKTGQNAGEQLDNLIRTTGVQGFDMECVEAWCEIPESEHVHANRKKGKVEMTWQERYADTIMKIEKLDTEIKSSSNPDRMVALNKQIESLEKQLTSAEHANKLRDRWTTADDSFKEHYTLLEDKRKCVLIMQMKVAADELHFHHVQRTKYSDGQQQAVRITKQLRKLSAKLRKQVKNFNDTGFSTTDGKFPSRLTYKDVNDGTAYIYSINQEEEDCLVPLKVKYEAMKLWNRVERAKEEKDQVVKEMHAVVSHLKDTINRLQFKISSLDSSRYDLGVKQDALQKIEEAQVKLEDANTMFKSYILHGSEPEEDPFYNTDESDDDEDSEDDDEDSEDDDEDNEDASEFEVDI